MSGRFVRASKYRHVFGRPTKKEQCYDNLRVSKNAWDTNLVKANPEYISVNWEASGGGAFAVIPLSERGKLPERIPLFRGHTAAVLDTDWNPFDDSLIASGSDDSKIFLWKVPDNFTVRPEVKADQIEDIAPIAKLSGHTRKVGHVLYNPAAADVLASSSGDYTVKVWDLKAEQPKLTLKHNDIVQSLSWNASGSMLVTTCRDKKLRMWDVRQEKPVVETAGHSGAKNSRAVWLGDHDRVATTGFSKMSDRQLGLWDVRAPREPIEMSILDQISGVCMPFWDDGNQMLYLAGKGDGNIRYYEYQNDKFEFLSQHSSTEPQRGIAFLPKRGVDTHENEITRAFKIVEERLIEPISFIVPRRAEVFQDDIYPPCTGTKPGLSSSDFFAGKNGLPPKISLASLHDGETPKEIPADYKPPSSISNSTPASSSTTASAPISKPTKASLPDSEPSATTSTTLRGPPPQLKDNKASIGAMASKFADKDEEEADDDDDDASSFEEVPRPAVRSAGTPSSPAPSTLASAPVPKASSSSVPPTSSASTTTPLATATSTALPKAVEQPSTAHRSTPSTASLPGGATGSAAEGLRSKLDDIKSLLESQARTIAAQSQKIDALGRDVAVLKAGSAGGKGAGSAAADEEDKDERIRMLELEIETLRG